MLKKDSVTGIAGRVLIIGCSVQIVLGMGWMGANLLEKQLFSPGAGQLSSLLCCLIYLLQLAAAFGASYRLLQSVLGSDRRRNIWGSFVMLTFPMAMQCHLALLPDSLVGSLLLLQLSLVAEAFSGEQKGEKENRGMLRLAGCALCWLLASFLLPEYLFLGAIPVLAMLFGKGAQKLSVSRAVLLILAVFGISLAGNSLLSAWNPGRALISPAQAFVGRFAWSSSLRTMEQWPDEIRENIPHMTLAAFPYYTSNVESSLAEPLIEALGEERAEQLMWQVAKIGLTYNARGIVQDCVWDALSYFFAPTALWAHLSQILVRESFSTRNYEIMRSAHPVLTKVYAEYTSWWFTVGLVIAAVTGILNGRGKKPAKTAGAGVVVFLSCAVVAWYTLQGAGVMDYKKTIFIGALWMLWLVAAADRSVRKGM